MVWFANGRRINRPNDAWRFDGRWNVDRKERGDERDDELIFQVADKLVDAAYWMSFKPSVKL
jgi:hypothetical protein